MKRLLLTLSLAVFAIFAQAKVQLPNIMGSGMVLQQNSKASLWGKAKAGAEVTVQPSWDNAKYTVKANGWGDWFVKVATPSYGGPYTIKISDGEMLELTDILIGEVWVCSGQSNMQMYMLGFSAQPVDGAAQALIDAASQRSIRMFSIPNKTSDVPLDSCGGVWMRNSAENAGGFSATAYYFALNLTKALGGVPVGVINTSWGGTQIQPWMPAECTKKVMDENYVRYNASDRVADNGKMGYIYNAMINPIVSYTARGFLWYQGESNRHQNGMGPNGTKVYTNLMQELVAQWRKDWGDTKNEMPFLYVQIAPYFYDDSNGLIRPLLVESQVAALKLIPNSAMAATTDIGSEFCIHPPQKDKVGERLALLAMDKAYGLAGKMPVNGATVRGYEFKEGKAKVKMVPIAGRCTSPDPNNLLGFELCGEDKVFYPAKAKFLDRGENIEVVCDKVPNPIAVRFAFRNYIEINMYNVLGIPPYSFRSDNF